ncbi:flagellar biosynthesis protein FlhF [Salibacterium halotolerans]|uniref:Flagellar biosynthesis protein FlhF n=1 Tax=Salibacterium halotolerans TaxID=1884432 RepID=A0A1I5MEN6_9BACI|nr:flagellar biosynthesis protein FlhF [Salibacterium halotolerans]SFP08078.1 flagellar biosynthesis protein FlhF [Salibacterium halotolerans]
MKVKKFKAGTMPEAMTKIQADLGDDAVILNSRHVNAGGFLGLFTKKYIEVIAAKEDTPAAAPAPAPQKKRQALAAQNAAPLQTSSAPSKEKLEEDVRELKTMINGLHEKTNTSTGGYPAPIKRIADVLEDQEVEETWMYELLRHLLGEWYRSFEKADSERVQQWAAAHLNELLPREMGPSESMAQMVNLVGPTGVGKTTTAAKTAAYYHLEENKSVAFITTDTYRIAAVDQLKTYAEILDIPVAVAYSMEDFREAKEQFSDRDLVIVDSAGRNFTNPLYVKELSRMIDFEEKMDTYLVLALTSKFKDMKTIYEQFSLLTIDRFVFTKKDETASYGAMFNLMARTGIPAAYVTYGQSVPDDMEEVDHAKVTQWLLGEAEHE